jgi:hypothetical protein
MFYNVTACGSETLGNAANCMRPKTLEPLKATSSNESISPFIDSYQSMVSLSDKIDWRQFQRSPHLQRCLSMVVNPTIRHPKQPCKLLRLTQRLTEKLLPLPTLQWMIH